MFFNLDSFYTFWLIIQSADPNFNSTCEIMSISTFMSQQVHLIKQCKIIIIFNKNIKNLFVYYFWLL